MNKVFEGEQYRGEIPLHKFILLVEDNDLLATLLVTATTRQTTYLIERVVDGQSALEVIKHIQPDLLVLDYQLPDINGLELYERIHAAYDRSYDASIPTIFASSDFPDTIPTNTRTLCLDKPFSIRQFLDAVRALFDFD